MPAVAAVASHGGCIWPPAVECSGGPDHRCARASENKNRSSLLDCPGLYVKAVPTLASPMDHVRFSGTAPSCGYRMWLLFLPIAIPIAFCSAAAGLPYCTLFFLTSWKQYGNSIFARLFLSSRTSLADDTSAAPGWAARQENTQNEKHL